jgi:hypothetical protein
MRARSDISACATPRTQTAFVFSVPTCFANFSGRIPLQATYGLDLNVGFF